MTREITCRNKAGDAIALAMASPVRE